jgi:hypothetical protein
MHFRGAGLWIVLAAVTSTCRTSSSDPVNSPRDEEEIWRAWFAELQRQPLRLALLDTTLTKKPPGGELGAPNVAQNFAKWEQESPELRQAITSAKVAELARRLESEGRVSRKIGLSIVPRTEALVSAAAFDQMAGGCDGCGWSQFRQRHPGFDGVVSVSRAEMLGDVSLLYFEQHLCGSASGSLVLMKRSTGGWHQLYSAGMWRTAGECPDAAQPGIAADGGSPRR